MGMTVSLQHFDWTLPHVHLFASHVTLLLEIDSAKVRQGLVRRPMSEEEPCILIHQSIPVLSI